MKTAKLNITYEMDKHGELHRVVEFEGKTSAVMALITTAFADVIVHVEQKAGREMLSTAIPALYHGVLTLRTEVLNDETDH